MKRVLAIIACSSLLFCCLCGCQEERASGDVTGMPTTLREDIPILIDSDGNISDFYALAYVNTCDKLNLRAITVTHGATNLEQAGINVLSSADFYGFDCPVALGMRWPIGQETVAHSTRDGENGLGGVVLPTPKRDFDARPAWQVMYEIAKEEGGKLHIVSMGPLTNIAKAIEEYPDFPSLIAEITTTASVSNFDMLEEEEGIIHAPIGMDEPDLFNDRESLNRIIDSKIPLRLVGANVRPIFKVGFVPGESTQNTLDMWLNPQSEYSEYFLRVRQYYKSFGDYGDYGTFPSIMALLSLVDDQVIRFEKVKSVRCADRVLDIARLKEGDQETGIAIAVEIADEEKYNRLFMFMPQYYGKRAEVV